MTTKILSNIVFFIVTMLMYCSCKKNNDLEKNTYKMHGLHTWTGVRYFWPYHPGNGMDSSTINYVHDDSIIVIDEKHIVFSSDTLYYSFTDTKNKKNIFVYFENYMGLGEVDTLTHYYKRNYIEFYSSYSGKFGNGEVFAHTP